MRHAYFHKAVTSAFDQIIPSENTPVYFLYFEISPELIDINIHPQKTEINFENQNGLFQIIRTGVKEALGKYNIAPAIDFDQEGAIDIPYFSKDKEVVEPVIPVNPNYNPFETEKSEKSYSNFNSQISHKQKSNLDNWESLYDGFLNQESKETKTIQTTTGVEEQAVLNKIFQLK